MPAGYIFAYFNCGNTIPANNVAITQSINSGEFTSKTLCTPGIYRMNNCRANEEIIAYHKYLFLNTPTLNTGYRYDREHNALPSVDALPSMGYA